MSGHVSNVRPAPDKVLAQIADYVCQAQADQQGRLRNRALLPDGHARLRLRGARVPGLHQAARAARAGHGGAERRQGAGHPVPARPGAGRVQHRRHDPLARLQRHLARRRMGAPLGQPGRDPRRRRLGLAQREEAAADARRADGHDQGARDPGRDRAREQLQPRRPRPRAAGQGRHRRGGGADDRLPLRRGGQRRVAGLGRRPEPAHLPPCAEHRLAQELGRRRRHQPRRAPGPDLEDRRDGLPLGADGQDLGLLRRLVQGQAVQVPAPVRLLRDGERAVQDLLPRRVPLADRGRVRDADPRGARRARTASPRTSGRSPSAPTRPACGSSTRRARSTTRPTATTASSTWWRCRSCSAA